MQFENPRFPRGDTFFGIGGTTDTTSGAEWEGKIYADSDKSYSDTSPDKGNRTTAIVYTMIVRNVSGIALLPKRVVTFKAGKIGQVDGYCTTDAQAVAGVVDEWLPSTGVPANDLFHMVIKGPAKVLTDIAAASGNVINALDYVVALTAATSQATTAGRVATSVITFQVTSNVTDGTIQKYAANRIGFALSAKTTANTNADLLLYVKLW